MTHFYALSMYNISQIMLTFRQNRDSFFEMQQQFCQLLSVFAPLFIATIQRWQH